VTVLVGTSGWQYQHWRGRFYPRGTPVDRWLETYAAAFATVESNAAFYRLPEKQVFRSWAERTPDDFVMAVKVSRYLTHIRRLRDPSEPVDRFVARAEGLGAKLGPVLLQLPPRFGADPDRLTRALDQFPSSLRVAVEFRDPSWYRDDIRRVLEDHRAALCLADRRGVVSPLWRTADWTYLRFHEGRSRPAPTYGRQALASWARRLRDGWGRDADAVVYFNNDPAGAAPRDAARFARLIERAGMRASRTPVVRSIRAG
jgi:uncharacterized protein YecE (DUF72 family)